MSSVRESSGGVLGGGPACSDTFCLGLTFMAGHKREIFERATRTLSEQAAKIVIRLRVIQPTE